MAKGAIDYDANIYRVSAHEHKHLRECTRVRRVNGQAIETLNKQGRIRIHLHCIIRFPLLALCSWTTPATAQADTCAFGIIDAIGDGRCDAENNIASCGYDGGDCCDCTCFDGPEYACEHNGFDCIDPTCTDYDHVAASYPNCTRMLSWVGDGWCDVYTNIPSCGYDGGDCCECTCVEGSDYQCDTSSDFCTDPACADPAVVAEFPQCMGNLLWLGDGNCNIANNNPECGICDCIDQDYCSLSGFNCLDPSAGDEIHECRAWSPPLLPCSDSVQRMWVIEDSIQARSLAETVNCSDGVFDVEWRGHIVLNETIHVSGGTVLNIRGGGSNASMDGMSDKRLFNLVSATLLLNDMTIKSGFALVGGAIAASASTLILNETSFIDNTASGVGGALYITNGSSVFVNGETTFIQNAAMSDGGALYVSGNSDVQLRGLAVQLINNTAGGDGGAIAARGESFVSWIGNTVFSNNTSGEVGGAFDALGGVIVFWDGYALFSNNSAIEGGALSIRRNSSVLWSGETTFSKNYASVWGGTFSIYYGSRASWGGETEFAGNRAGYSGGALVVEQSSNASWCGMMAFTANRAEYRGGALLVGDGSKASWSGGTVFTQNRAGESGGAMFAYAESTVTWTGETMFVANYAGVDGGVLYAIFNSAISWNSDSNSASDASINGDMMDGTAESSSVSSGVKSGSSGTPLEASDSTDTSGGLTTFERNIAGNMGGALYIWSSRASWGGKTTFSGNAANVSGGAIFVNGFVVSWSGATSFYNNYVTNGNGGAFAAHFSSVLWSGATNFTNNSAANSGGALYALQSILSWSTTTKYIGNRAKSNGGAVSLYTSIASWSGPATSFIFNQAIIFGGAVYALGGSFLSWSGSTLLKNNTGGVLGGGLAVFYESRTEWSGETTFFGNAALDGGGLSLYNSSIVEISGPTEFVHNYAERNGGAVGVIEDSSELDVDVSAINITGPTIFVNNTCEENGGALALTGSLSVTFETTDVTFAGNSAQVAGGAILVSGIDIGPTFRGVSFLSNSAKLGGGVYVTSSGNAKISITSDGLGNPTTFEGCSFVDNTAEATGGAIQSTAGQDEIRSSSFVGNKARVGGAMRLEGIAYLDNCSFVDNISDEAGGAAVSNIGFILGITDILFEGNVYSCTMGTFLEYNASGDPYEVICQGCTTSCERCSFDEPPVVPFCTNALSHTTSAGGLTTLDMISINRGYWRATTSSVEILPCYNTDACLGGVTGTSTYCREGYEGPYCDICSDGYTKTLGFVCDRCSHGAGGIALAVILAVMALVAVVLIACYVLEGEQDITRRGLIERVMRYIPLQSLKIVVVVWQILTQFTSVAKVAYPHVYQRFLDWVNVFNFDLGWILSVGCVVEVDFHDQLLFATLGPIVTVAFLVAMYAVAMYKYKGSEQALQNVRHKLVSAMLLLTFLVYSGVSSILFQTFTCERLDDGKYYVRADYRIECDSPRHEVFKIYAGFMIVVYVVGIPAMYAGLLFKDRDVLRKNGAGRNEDIRVRSTSQLWRPYNPSVFYFEVIECVRRIALAGVIVFIYPNSSAQIAVTLVIAFAFSVLSEGLNPYASRWDTWVSRTGHVVLFVSVYVALLLKVNVSEERSESQTIFEAILVSAHGCMVAVIIVEAVVLACSLRGTRREDPSPRSRNTKLPRWRSNFFLQAPASPTESIR